MSDIEPELDRVLTLLRNKIRERGFTQLEVQQALGWGRSYISQLLTKQKSLRVEQVLMILSVIDFPPNKFFDELFHYSLGGEGRQGYRLSAGAAPSFSPAVSRPSPREEVSAELASSVEDLRATVGGMLRVLIDKKIIDADELSSVLRGPRGGPVSGELDAG